MKKKLYILLLLVFVVGLTACTSKKKDIHKSGKPEDLLDVMVESYNKKDFNKMIEVLPEFMKKDIDMTNEEWKKQIEDEYGNDLKVTYELKNKNKKDENEIQNMNAIIKNYYNVDETISECYELEGTITFKSSKKTTSDDLIDIHYCKINDKWYLLLD